MDQAWARLVGPTRILVGLLALGVCAGAIAVAEAPGRFTTYPGRLPAVMALEVVAGLALVAAGIATTLGSHRGSIGWLAAMAGLTWFAPTWIAWQNGPPLVPSLAMVLSGLTFAFVFHLVLAYPSGRTQRTSLRIIVWLVYVETFVAALGLALFRDPYFDPGCLANCNVNVFLVRSLPSLAHALLWADRWLVAAAAIGMAFVCFARLAAATTPARRELAPVAVPGALFAVAVVARAAELRRVTVEDPFDDVLLATFIAAGLALTLLAAGLIAAVLRTWRQRRAVLRIATDLDEAPEPGSVRSALAEALGDPELRVAYPLADGTRFVDADGRSIPGGTDDVERTNTTLVRDDQAIAVVSHAARVTDLGSQIGPAVLLALENERLQAELLAELEELRASRTRIVETSDTERRRLERNLHDGAQQRLLALSFDIRLARAAAEHDCDVTTGALLTEATAQTQAALDELRDIAHGIYPAILAEAGLAPALETFADTSGVSVDLHRADSRRYTAAAEAAAYFAATEAVDEALRRGARNVTIAIAEERERLVVTVDDDGPEPRTPMVEVADRVGALGGEVDLEATFRVEIPCG